MRRFGLLSFIVVLILLSFALPTVTAQYAIPDCFVARVNSTFPQEQFWAARDAWYRELGSEWNTQVTGLTPEQITAYTAAFCETLIVTDGGDSEDGQSRIVEWSYQPVSSWLAESGGQTAPNDPASSEAASTGTTDTTRTTGSSAPGGTALAGPGIFSTEFDTLPSELILEDDEANRLPGQIINSEGDNALRVKAPNYVSLYYDVETLRDYALEVRSRIHSGELLLTVRGGDDFCSGYEFHIYPGINYASLNVTDQDCRTTILDDLNGVPVANGEWATLRIEASGPQLTAYINDEAVLSAQDDTYTQGYATLFFMSEVLIQRDALIDVSALRVIPTVANIASVTSAPATSVPASGGLTQYAAAHGQAIAELQALGIVPEGHGTFIFQEPTAYFEGNGSWYTPLARSAPHTNIVIAGNLEVRFNAPSEYETCFIMTRIVTEGGTAVKELSVGIDSEGDVLIVDADDPDATNFSTYEYMPLRGSLDTSHHFLLVAMGNRATLYVDGEIYFERIKVEERAGTYGIGLSSYDSDSRCEANNLWLYSFD